MLCFIDKTTDPYFNLAAEEYLLTQYDEPIFRLWRNSPSIIVGRYQNTAAEINSDYISQNNIPVVRRLSGGGAVFHDLGNINFTFIDHKIEGEDTNQMFARFTAPIIEALHRIGIEAYLKGRNDLLIDGKKISGNALCIQNSRVLQHGTLLFSSSMQNLSMALNTRPEKFEGKSVKSNTSRVTNISEHLADSLKNAMTPEGFMDYLHGFIMSLSTDYKVSSYREEEIAAINTLAKEKYRTSEWNYGKSPAYTFSNTSRLPCGLIEVYLNVEKGIISECHIKGDYFLTLPTEELENSLIGLQHRYDDIYSVLDTLPLNRYISGIDIDSLTDIILH